MGRHTDRCAACGRPLPPSPIFPSVSKGLARRIVETVYANPGISGPELMRVLYGNRPDGGPHARTLISVIVHGARRQLAQDGFAIVASRGCGGGYRIERLAKEPAPGLTWLRPRG